MMYISSKQQTAYAAGLFASHVDSKKNVYDHAVSMKAGNTLFPEQFKGEDKIIATV